jgi:hypothetical protein
MRFLLSPQIFDHKLRRDTVTSKSTPPLLRKGKHNTFSNSVAEIYRKAFFLAIQGYVSRESVKNMIRFVKCFLMRECPVVLIVYSDNPAQIIETKMSGGMYSAQYLLMIMQNNYQHGKLVYTTLSDLASAKNSAPVPVIESEEDIIKFNGLCLMKDDGSAGIMPSDEVIGVKFLRNEVLSNDSITIPVVLPEGNTAVTVRSSKTKRCASEDNGIIAFS